MEKYNENGNLKKEYYDESNGLWYELKGDYYYPMITVPKQGKIVLGKYGRARLNYIKQYKTGLYTELLMKQQNLLLKEYLKCILREKVFNKYQMSLMKKNY